MAIIRVDCNMFYKLQNELEEERAKNQQLEKKYEHLKTVLHLERIVHKNLQEAYYDLKNSEFNMLDDLIQSWK